MKATGIVRRIDDLGRIVIPIELRRQYGIEQNSMIELFTTEEGIVIKKYLPSDSLFEHVRDFRLILNNFRKNFDPQTLKEAEKHIKKLEELFKND